ncbi:MAG: ATP-binding protein [Candidatus Thermoplasmatota archaeon]
MINWIYLAGALISLIIGLLVYCKGAKKEVKKIFLLFSITVFYWGITYYGLSTSSGYDVAYIWHKIGALWPFAIATLLHFALVFAGKEKWFKRKLIYISLYGPAIIFSVVEIFSDNLYRLVKLDSGWSSTMADRSSLFFYSSNLWSLFCVLLSIFICISFYLSTRKYKEKKQVSYVIMGLFMPILFSISTEIMLPSFLESNIPNLTFVGYSIGLILISFPIVRYDLFEIKTKFAAEKIISEMPDMLMLVDTEGRIQEVNRSTMENLKYSKDELIGRSTESLFKIQKRINKGWRNDGINKYNGLSGKQNILISKNGRKIPVYVSKSPIKDDSGSIIGTLFICKDITDIKKRDRKIRQYVKKLEDNELAMLSMMEDLRLSKKEIESLNKNLEKKVAERTAEVKKLLKQKDDFIHMLGHDLKNPMTPLSALIPVVKERIDDPKSLEILDVVTENVEYMKALVFKTLKLARLNSPTTKFDLEYINLFDESKKAINSNKMIFEENNINIKNNIDKNLTVYADELRLNELFKNILTNSVKYTPDGGNIELDAEDKGDFVKVSVSDDGIGMDEEQLVHIFDEFYKADSARHDFDSSGLGLPICKRIVKKHGGKIWANSKGKGKGTTFFFTLKKDDK